MLYCVHMDPKSLKVIGVGMQVVGLGGGGGCWYASSCTVDYMVGMVQGEIGEEASYPMNYLLHKEGVYCTSICTAGSASPGTALYSTVCEGKREKGICCCT